MNLGIISTNKKRNSTQVVNGTFVSITTDLKLKENTNLTYPTFIIRRSAIGDSAFPTGNYLKVVDNTKTYYYFIDSWESGKDGCWYIHCTMDVLATYKTSILSQELYVLRSSSTYNLNIQDNKYVADLNYQYDITTFNGDVTIKNIRTGNIQTSSNYFNNNPVENGFYYVKVLDSRANLGVVTYMMDYSGFSEFITKLFTIDYSKEFPDIADGLARSNANVIQYVLECYWLPCNIPGPHWDVRDIYLGVYPVEDILCAVISDYPSLEINFRITPAQHPQYERGHYVNGTPYTYRSLLFYPYGVYSLNDNALSVPGGLGALDVFINLDTYTGESTLRVETTAGHAIVVTDAKDYKVPIQLTETQLTLIGVIGAGLRAYGNMAQERANTLLHDYKTNPESFSFRDRADYAVSQTEADIWGSSNGLGTYLQNSGSELNKTGTTGAFMSFSIKPYVASVFYPLVDEDLSHIGRPLCKKKVLSTLSGYCLCNDSDIEINNCTTDQINLIRRFLTSGFFIE